MMKIPRVRPRAGRRVPGAKRMRAILAGLRLGGSFPV